MEALESSSSSAESDGGLETSMVTGQKAKDTEPSVAGKVSECLPQDGGKQQAKRLPRPQNAFMVFSNVRRKQLKQQHPELPNVSISEMLGHEWAVMTTQVKQQYYDLAEQRRDKFLQENPNFSYSRGPGRKKQAKSKVVANEKQERPRRGKSVAARGSSAASASFAVTEAKETAKGIVASSITTATTQQEAGMVPPSVDQILGVMRRAMSDESLDWNRSDDRPPVPTTTATNPTPTRARLPSRTLSSDSLDCMETSLAQESLPSLPFTGSYLSSSRRRSTSTPPRRFLGDLATSLQSSIASLGSSSFSSVGGFPEAPSISGSGTALATPRRGSHNIVDTPPISGYNTGAPSRRGSNNTDHTPPPRMFLTTPYTGHPAMAMPGQPTSTCQDGQAATPRSRSFPEAPLARASLVNVHQSQRGTYSSQFALGHGQLNFVSSVAPQHRRYAEAGLSGPWTSRPHALARTNTAPSAIMAQDDPIMPDTPYHLGPDVHHHHHPRSHLSPYPPHHHQHPPYLPMYPVHPPPEHLPPADQMRGPWVLEAVPVDHVPTSGPVHPQWVLDRVATGPAPHAGPMESLGCSAVGFEIERGGFNNTNSPGTQADPMGQPYQPAIGPAAASVLRGSSSTRQDDLERLVLRGGHLFLQPIRTAVRGQPTIDQSLPPNPGHPHTSQRLYSYSYSQPLGPRPSQWDAGPAAPWPPHRMPPGHSASNSGIPCEPARWVRSGAANPSAGAEQIFWTDPAIVASGGPCGPGPNPVPSSGMDVHCGPQLVSLPSARAGATPSRNSLSPPPYPQQHPLGPPAHRLYSPIGMHVPPGIHAGPLMVGGLPPPGGSTTLHVAAPATWETTGGGSVGPNGWVTAPSDWRMEPRALQLQQQPSLPPSDHEGWQQGHHR